MNHDDRIDVIRNAFDASAELDLQHPGYREKIVTFLDEMIHADLRQGDVSQLPHRLYETEVKAKIIAKTPGVLAGLDEAVFYLKRRHLDIRTDYCNGNPVNTADVLMNIRGKASEILTIERSLLNLLQRLSGIATTTKSYRDKIADKMPFIAGTRKTLWGVLDKSAIRWGGGLTHRLGLYDAAMLKENHLRVLSNSGNPEALHYAVSEIISAYPYLRFIEIEVGDAREYHTILRFLENITAPFPFVIMFDHFAPEEIKSLIAEVKGKPHYHHLLFEASGNITLDRVTSYTDCGVDVLSVGALTHSTLSADFSLLIERD